MAVHNQQQDTFTGLLYELSNLSPLYLLLERNLRPWFGNTFSCDSRLSTFIFHHFFVLPALSQSISLKSALFFSYYFYLGLFLISPATPKLGLPFNVIKKKSHVLISSTLNVIVELDQHSFTTDGEAIFLLMQRRAEAVKL